MTDRIDEWALNYLTEFDGTPLHSVTKGAVDLGKLQDEDEKKALDEANEQMKPLIEKLQEVLKDSAKSVRITTRLVDSPACLVVDEHELSPQMIKMFKQMGQDVPEPKPILEINPEHALVKRLEKNESEFADLAHVIFDQAKIADGQIPADPAGYLKRVNALLLA